MRSSRGILGTLLVGLLVAALGFGCASASAAWTILSTSVPAGTSESRLFGVSCQSEIPCWAVGEYRNSSGVLEPFAWNPLTASYALPPTPGSHPQLTDVSCPQSATNNLCMAVGRFVNSSGSLQAFAEKYTSSTGVWELQTLTFPSGNTASELGSISCATEGECVAVGDYHNSTGIHYLAERWTSLLGWVPETPKEAPGIGYQALTGISCPAPGECVSVGEYRVSPYSLSSQRLETEKFTSGTWDYQGLWPGAGKPFAPSPGTVPALGTISCFAAVTGCIGVGYYTNTTPALQMMAWQTAGTTSGWEQQSMTALSEKTQLTGVSCRTAAICVAVGQRTLFTVGSALAEELSGGTWSQITLPTVSGSSESTLNRDTCIARSGVNFCLAVGWSVVGGVTSLLVERNF